MKKLMILWLRLKMFFTKAETIVVDGEAYRAKKIGTISLEAYGNSERLSK